MISVSSKVLAVAATLASTMSLASAQSMGHVARIPVGSDLSSVRYEGTKIVTIPVAERLVNDSHYCQQAALRDPGGSMFCDSATWVKYAKVYQVTYSYKGLPLASDEYGNTRSTFNIYFRQDELSPAEQVSSIL